MQPTTTSRNLSYQHVFWVKSPGHTLASGKHPKHLYRVRRETDLTRVSQRLPPSILPSREDRVRRRASLPENASREVLYEDAHVRLWYMHAPHIQSRRRILQESIRRWPAAGGRERNRSSGKCKVRIMEKDRGARERWREVCWPHA